MYGVIWCGMVWRGTVYYSIYGAINLYDWMLLPLFNRSLNTVGDSRIRDSKSAIALAQPDPRQAFLNGFVVHGHIRYKLTILKGILTVGFWDFQLDPSVPGFTAESLRISHVTTRMV